MIGIFTLLCCSITLAQDFDLPEVIWYHVGMPRAGLFAEEFTCVGDQNGDGYDDLLVNHRALNRVELFYGGEEMDNEPDLLFINDEEYMGIGRYIWNVGNLLPNREPFFSVSKVYQNREEDIVIGYQRMFESGEELDNEPDYIFTAGYQYGLFGAAGAYRGRPFSFNGDEYDDLVTCLYDGERWLTQVYFGGADFDTIPDWETECYDGGTRASTGYDINSDGYDDLLVSSDSEPTRKTMQLFLGGEEPADEPVFTIPWDHFEGLEIRYGFALLPDVNGDGYDDWGIHFNDDPATWDGYYIFFGGDEPDMEPDVLLAGNAGGTGDRRGEICGGDFNNDGYGDIVTSDPSAGYGQGQLNYFFGRPELPDEMAADILINMERDFEEDYGSICGKVGAVGDYNGDGIEDLLSVNWGEYGRILIFAGNDDWRVNSVAGELPTSYDLSVEAYPNPFNDTVKISFEIPQSGEVKMSIYNIQGQLLEELTNKTFIPGTYTTSWNADGYSTGIYFAVLELATINITEIDIEKVILIR